jgi:hypothetical protein
LNYLQIITIEEKNKWDSIVRSFNNYDVNYLSGYAYAFQVHGDGEPLLFYYNDGNCRAINVVMKRDISEMNAFKESLDKNTWFDLSSPYGYGGFLVEGTYSEVLIDEFDRYCTEHGFISEFVRFHLFNNFYQHYNGLCATYTHNIIRTLDLPLEDMLMDFEHKVRKNIKRANSSGLQIMIDNTGECLEDFLRIYYNTMDRTGAQGNYYFKREFFEALNKMEGNYAYLHVLKDDIIISTELVLYGSENCYSFLGGTDSEYFNLRPNDFLKYEIIKWAKSHELKRFILGGGYGEDDGIFQYKKSFAPNGIIDFYIGKKIFDNEKYNFLLDIRKSRSEQMNDKYFPQYRG